MKDGDRASTGQRIGLWLSEEEVAAVDDWGFAHRIRSRSKTLRQLINAGLQNEVATTGVKFGDPSPVEAGNNMRQETNDARNT